MFCVEWETADVTPDLRIMNPYFYGIGGEESSVIVANIIAGDSGETFILLLSAVVKRRIHCYRQPNREIVILVLA